MFGMSSEDFWENDPKLYWAYRTFYLKQKEVDAEEERYKSWLQGSLTYMAVSIALGNAFSKSKQDYPSYEKLFAKNKEDGEPNKPLTKEEIKQKAVDNYNMWARY